MKRFLNLNGLFYAFDKKLPTSCFNISCFLESIIAISAINTTPATSSQLRPLQFYPRHTAPSHRGGPVYAVWRRTGIPHPTEACSIRGNIGLTNGSNQNCVVFFSKGL